MESHERCSEPTSSDLRPLSTKLLWFHRSIVLRVLIITFGLVFESLAVGTLMQNVWWTSDEQYKISVLAIGLVVLQQCVMFFPVYRVSRGMDVLFLAINMGLLLWTLSVFKTQDPLLLREGGSILAALIMVILLLVLKVGDWIKSGFLSFGSPFELGWKSDVKCRFEKFLQHFSRSVKLRIYMAKGLVATSLLTLIVIFASSGTGPLTYAVKNQEPLFITLLPVLVLVVILTHHTLSFFRTPVLHRATDILLLPVELSSVFAALHYEWKESGYYINAVSCLITLFCLSVLLFTRLCDLVLFSYKGPLPFERYDILNGHHISPRISLLLGRTAWTEMSLKGEPVLIKIIRGMLAIGALVFLIISYVLIMTRGISNNGKAKRLDEFSLAPQWKAEFNLTTPYIYISPVDETIDPVYIRQAVIVTKSCPSILGNKSDGNIRGKLRSQTCSASNKFDDLLNVSLFTCHESGTSEMATHFGFYCETHIQVDFALLASKSEVPGITGYDQGVYIRIGGGNITDPNPNVYPPAHLQPFVLFENENLQGNINVHVKEILSSPEGLNSFGYGRTYTQLVVGQIVDVRPNINTSFDATNRSSMRLRSIDPLTQRGRLVREYSNYTMTQAFANLGGMWTFANGLFTMVFGGSLLYFLLGIKPLSRFGLVHFLVRGRLRKATTSHYPRFHSEGGRPGDPEAGVVAFLREHLVDVIAKEDSLPADYPLYPGATNLDLPFTMPEHLHSVQSCSIETFPSQDDEDKEDYRSDSGSSSQNSDRIPLQPLRYGAL